MSVSVQPGHTFIWGLRRETAQALLAAAERLDLDPYVVRTVADGFVVPDAVADEAAVDLRTDMTVDQPITDQPSAEF